MRKKEKNLRKKLSRTGAAQVASLDALVLKRSHSHTSSMRRSAQSKIASRTLARSTRDGHTKHINAAFSAGCVVFMLEKRPLNVEVADGKAPNIAATESQGAELCTPASKNADRNIVVARGSSTNAVGMPDRGKTSDSAPPSGER
jgi:hypothetical protein